MTTPTDDQIKTYLAKGGVACVFCEKTDRIQAGSLDHAGFDTAYQQVTCGHCDREWTDCYSLTNVHVDEPTKRGDCPCCGMPFCAKNLHDH